MIGGRRAGRTEHSCMFAGCVLDGGDGQTEAAQESSLITRRVKGCASFALNAELGRRTASRLRSPPRLARTASPDSFVLHSTKVSPAEDANGQCNGSLRARRRRLDWLRRRKKKRGIVEEREDKCEAMQPHLQVNHASLPVRVIRSFAPRICALLARRHGASVEPSARRVHNSKQRSVQCGSVPDVD